MAERGTDTPAASSAAPRPAGSRLSGYLMMSTAALLFGFNGNLARVLFDRGISPVTLVEFRMLIGCLCLLALLLLGRRQALKLPWRQGGWIVAFGLALALVSFSYFVAISRLPVAIALVIQFSAPAWMVLGGILLTRRLPTWYVALALALTFGGIVLLTGAWQQNLSGLDPLGLLFAGFSVVTYIAYMLLGRRLGRDLPSLTSITYGAFVATLFWLLVQPPWTIPANAWQPSLLLPILLVGSIGMAVPFSLVLGSLRRLDATRASIASTLELAAGSAIAYLWLHQTLTPWQAVGCLLVLVGVVALQYEKSAGYA